MKLILESDEAVLLEAGESPGLEIEPAQETIALSPFHLLAASLAICTYSVLWGWAQHAQLGVADLQLRGGWSFAESPKRVGSIALQLRWPSLPPERWSAALRAAELCTIHATLAHPPDMHISMEGEGPRPDGGP
jgi:uncharacterized OsmC-like protein